MSWIKNQYNKVSSFINVKVKLTDNYTVYKNISPREENFNVGLHIEMNICTYNVVGTCNSYMEKVTYTSTCMQFLH